MNLLFNFSCSPTFCSMILYLYHLITVTELCLEMKTANSKEQNAYCLENILGLGTIGLYAVTQQVKLAFAMSQTLNTALVLGF